MLASALPTPSHVQRPSLPRVVHLLPSRVGPGALPVLAWPAACARACTARVPHLCWPPAGCPRARAPSWSRASLPQPAQLAHRVRYMCAHTRSSHGRPLTFFLLPFFPACIFSFRLFSPSAFFPPGLPCFFPACPFPSAFFPPPFPPPPCSLRPPPPAARAMAGGREVVTPLDRWFTRP